MSQTDVLVELARHAMGGNQPAIRQSVERLIAETEFLADHPQYELVDIETRPSGLRLWYTYPIDEYGREVR